MTWDTIPRSSARDLHFPNLIQHRIRSPADQVWRNFAGHKESLKMSTDIADRSDRLR